MNMQAKSHPRLDANEIVPGLWQGAYPRVHVNQLGFQALVLCARELQVSSQPTSVIVMRAPLEDGNPTSDELRLAQRVAHEVARRVRFGQNVLVTCAMGINRSGLVTGLAIRELNPKMPGEMIVKHIQSRRPVALTNAYFRAVLKRLP
jgi:protein-tyrosine phosphatase